MPRWFQSGLAVALILACTATLHAQSDKKKKREEAGLRVVEGTVVDADEKTIEGAVVKLKDLKTLQIRSFITKPDGSYHFSGLKTENDYELKADFSGASSQAKRLSVFDERKIAIINLKLEKKAP
jgi:hypothetical protein